MLPREELDEGLTMRWLIIVVAGEPNLSLLAMARLPGLLLSVRQLAGD